MRVLVIGSGAREHALLLGLRKDPAVDYLAIAPVVAGAMAQATGSFKGALWLTAAVMLVGMALLLALPKET